LPAFPGSQPMLAIAAMIFPQRQLSSGRNSLYLNFFGTRFLHIANLACTMCSVGHLRRITLQP